MQNQELKRDLGKYLERIGTGVASDAYREGWERTFGKQPEPEGVPEGPGSVADRGPDLPAGEPA